MIKAIIIDDEQHCIKTLKWSIETYLPEKVEIIAATINPLEGRKLIEQLNPDLIFLDIEMPHLNGIELAQSISNNNTKIIFTTAYDQYAIRAIKLSALDYLLKPILKEELEAAIEKYVEIPIATHEQLTNFKENKLVVRAEKLGLNIGGEILFVHFNEILCIEAKSNYSQVFLTENRKYLLSKTLQTFEEALTGNQFFRVHKSYLINLDYVSKYIKGDGGEILLTNGMHVVVSRTRKDEFLDMFNKL